MRLGEAVTGMEGAARFPLRWPILGGWVIAAAFVVAIGAWSAVAPMSSATIASAAVRNRCLVEKVA